MQESAALIEGPTDMPELQKCRATFGWHVASPITQSHAECRRRSVMPCGSTSNNQPQGSGNSSHLMFISILRVLPISVALAAAFRRGKMGIPALTRTISRIRTVTASSRTKKPVSSFRKSAGQPFPAERPLFLAKKRSKRTARTPQLPSQPRKRSQGKESP